MVHTTTVIQLKEKATRFAYGKREGVPILAIKAEDHTYPSGFREKSINDIEDYDIIIKFDTKDMIDNMINTLEYLKEKN